MNPWRGLGGLPREVWVLFATMLVNRAGTMALPFLVLYLTKHMGVPPERAGLALLVYGIGALVTAPISGRLADSFGARRVVKLSLLVSGTLLLAFPALRSFSSILVATLVWSVTSEAYRPAAYSILAQAVAPERRKAAFAAARLAVNLGMGIGPVVGGFLARVSYPSLYFVDGATSILAGLVAVAWLGSSPAHEAPLAREATEPRSRWRTIFPDARALYFLIALLPVMSVFFQLNGAFSLFLVRDLGLPESAFGLMLSVNTTMIVFLEVPLNLKMAAWSHRRTLALGASLVGIGFGALSLVHGAWMAAATVVIWTFGEMILLPGSTAYMAEISPPDRRGAYMGFYQMAFSLAMSFGSSAGTAGLVHLGGPTFWALTFFLGILSAGLLSRLHETAQHPTIAVANGEPA